MWWNSLFHFDRLCLRRLSNYPSVECAIEQADQGRVVLADGARSHVSSGFLSLSEVD